MPIFRPRPSPFHTARAMVGAKGADRVLVIGSDQAQLAAEVALATGLNGQTMVAAPAAAHAAIERAAAAAGSLVEFAAGGASLGSTDLGPFDIVVVSISGTPEAPCSWSEQFAAALATLRPGGRIVALHEPARRRFRIGAGPGVVHSEVIRCLASTGALAGRHLGTADGVSYYEARRPQGGGFDGRC